MRDVNRIDRISEKIAILWKRYPDMRYWQFLSYLGGQLNYNGDFFFYEDSNFEIELDNLIGEDNGN